jgi:hypothetical protein
MEKRTRNHWFWTFLLFFLLPPSFLLLDISYSVGINYSIWILGITIYLLKTLHAQTGFRLKLQGTPRSIFVIYGLVLLFLAISAPFIYTDSHYLGKIYSVFIKNLLIGLLMYLLILKTPYNLRRLTGAWINVAFFFASASLILYAGFILGLIPLKSKLFPDNPNTFFNGYYLGYLNVIVQGIPRNQSWFTEAGQFAQFLMLPLFLSFRNLSVRRSRMHFLKFAVIFTAFVLTFSLANYYGLLAAVVLSQLIRLVRKRSFSLPALAGSIFIIFAAYIVIDNLYMNSNTKVGTSVISKEADNHIEDRKDRITFAFEVLETKPLGDISFRESKGTYIAKNRTTVGMLAINTGFPGLLLMAAIFVLLFGKIARYYGKQRDIDIYLTGFFAFFVAHWWYGDWISYFFIFHVAVVLRLIQEIEFSAREAKSNPNLQP